MQVARDVMQVDNHVHLCQDDCVLEVIIYARDRVQLQYDQP